MSELPRVSVLMTVYNAAPWLRDAVDSVVAQTYTDWELVVIENGSTDASPAILASYGDPRIRVVAMDRNVGRTPALRHALEIARGEFVAVLDADDLAAPSRFEKQVAFLDAHPDVALVGAWSKRIDGTGREVGVWEFPTDPVALRDHLAFANPIVHSAAMYRAALAREVGGYPETYPYGQDTGLWLALAERSGIGMIDEYLCTHRTLAGGMTRSKETRVLVARDLLALLESAAERLPLTAHAQRRNREERAIAACRYGIALMRAGHPGQAVSTLARAIVRHPRNLLWNRVYRQALGGRAA